MAKAKKSPTLPTLPSVMLYPVFPDEARIWTAEAKTAYMVEHFRGDPDGLARDRLWAWQKVANEAEAAVKRFKASYGCIDPSEKRKLTELELVAADARAMANRAFDLVDGL